MGANLYAVDVSTPSGDRGTVTGTIPIVSAATPGAGEAVIIRPEYVFEGPGPIDFIEFGSAHFHHPDGYGPRKTANV